ncbi:MAG: TRAP transporter large permease subunit [Candidatus Latescibacteria bacterium]|nr:TRAP transporter large permease subunit [Candidatus Latescibacterota bacterium]
MNTLYPGLMFLVAFIVLLSGFPVAFCLAGTALIFAFIGILFGHFDPAFLSALPSRIFGIMVNETLLAVPLFVFMGVVLERSKIAEDLLETMSQLFGGLRGGLGISVCLVGGLMAASTGIVGATVVTMGLISLPAMLKRRYDPALSTGVICASGTLGQIIPPSIVLVILGDVVSSANQQAQLALGNFSARSVSVGDLFMGALLPGVLLMGLYILYIIGVGVFAGEKMPPIPQNERSVLLSRSFLRRLLLVLAPPLVLIMGVLGSILFGVATPTEAAAVGAVGALLLSWLKKQLNGTTLRAVMQTTTEVNAMVFTILIGASVFSLVFRGYGGDEVVAHFLQGMGGGVVGSFILVMAVIFLLGFFLDFFEIIFVVVPIVGPILLQMGLDPVWLGVMIALNLQTSFLTPPFGFSLFYLRGVAPDTVTTGQIYRGAAPFIVIQLILLSALWFFPGLATWLPQAVFG